MLRTIAIAALAASLVACAGRARSVRIATHHPEYTDAYACHDRCTAAFAGFLDRAECFAGCPGVVTTRLACEEPRRWEGICYETHKGETPASAVTKAIGYGAAAIGAILVVSVAFALDDVEWNTEGYNN